MLFGFPTRRDILDSALLCAADARRPLTFF